GCPLLLFEYQRLLFQQANTNACCVATRSIVQRNRCCNMVMNAIDISDRRLYTGPARLQEAKAGAHTRCGFARKGVRESLIAQPPLRLPWQTPPTRNPLRPTNLRKNRV